jgi:hypothetical protein
MSGAVYSDTARSKLRGIAAKIDTDLSRISGQAATGELRVAISDLLEDWTGLISVLDLGPQPELRKCPVCSRFGMRDATLCGYCWTSLVPPDSGKSATAA